MGPKSPLTLFCKFGQLTDASPDMRGNSPRAPARMVKTSHDAGLGEFYTKGQDVPRTYLILNVDQVVLVLSNSVGARFF